MRLFSSPKNSTKWGPGVISNILGAHVTWLRDGAKVSAAKMETKAEGDSHSLVIKNATIEDVGEYICQAENVTSKTELEVQSKEEKIEVENHIMQQMGIKGEIFFHRSILSLSKSWQTF